MISLTNMIRVCSAAIRGLVHCLSFCSQWFKSNPKPRGRVGHYLLPLFAAARKCLQSWVKSIVVHICVCPDGRAMEGSTRTVQCPPTHVRVRTRNHFACCTCQTRCKTCQ